MTNNLTVLAVVALLGGCTALPEQVQVSHGQKLIGFSEVSENSVGESVRWGGIITELSKQDGVANVTITQYPLLASGQPTYASGSFGRFTAKLNNSLNIDRLEKGSVLTLIGDIEDVHNPYPELKSTQLAQVSVDGFYVWNGFSKADHSITLDNNPAFIQRGKWGWQVKSEKEKQRERQERINEQNSRY
ncbi:Slp family lipoprotein [uncultured Paraglaciecola sp.]|uniref:Slp family lipoprotein n=1 Tax=uncultured Paraglaciecola sp. TaxID=1765024 RepID=UPI0030DB34E2|tara:strand:- start:323005 stop:323571 length:567 start_codon:yes stop_codon:yes gene_type:complete